jgi:nucleoside-diphosphate-sugar epimerase
VIPNFCVQALRGEPITIYGDGRQTRSFCYVDDLVRGLALLGERAGLNGEVINLGKADEQTVAGIARENVSLAGSDSPIVFRQLPFGVAPIIKEARRLPDWLPQPIWGRASPPRCKRLGITPSLWGRIKIDKGLVITHTAHLIKWRRPHLAAAPRLPDR